MSDYTEIPPEVLQAQNISRNNVENWGKVTYLAREGYTTQAYIDTDTGLGTSKHTDCPLALRWDNEAQIWKQIDDWDWEYEAYSDRWVFKLMQVNAPPKEPFKRVQPKRLTRRERRNNR